MEEKSLSTVPDWIQEMAIPVDLHPDLVPYLESSRYFGEILKHPLVFSVPYHPALNVNLNRQYAAKKKSLDESFDRRDWHLYVFLHERPYRVQAFLEIRDVLTFEEYWEILGSVWSDSENLCQNKRVLRDLLRADLPHREAMMDDDEREFLSHLPDLVRVFRGYQTKNRNGMSWSLSYTVAEWFARRLSLGGPTGVVSGLIRKDRIKALLLGRGEVEVVALPEHVRDRKVFDVPERDYDLKRVFDHAWDQSPLNHRGRTFHGRSHWDKVDANAIRLCAETPGADIAVCRLFAALHDSRRENEGHDPDHGRRAAESLGDLLGEGVNLSRAQMELLHNACAFHDDGQVTDDPTIGVCWDADRLDLVRVGVLPNPELLSTEAARRLICQI